MPSCPRALVTHYKVPAHLPLPTNLPGACLGSLPCRPEASTVPRGTAQTPTPAVHQLRSAHQCCADGSAGVSRMPEKFRNGPHTAQLRLPCTIHRQAPILHNLLMHTCAQGHTLDRSSLRPPLVSAHPKHQSPTPPPQPHHHHQTLTLTPPLVRAHPRLPPTTHIPQPNPKPTSCWCTP